MIIDVLTFFTAIKSYPMLPDKMKWFYPQGVFSQLVTNIFFILKNMNLPFVTVAPNLQSSKIDCSGAILEIRLRVGVIPLNVTPLHAF